MIKKTILITTLWLLTIAVALAEIPKAQLSITPLNSGQWPAEFTLSLIVPKDHHAYLNSGDEDVYIPIKIDLNGELASSRLSLVIRQRPTGVYDNTVKASVLRDKGDFILAILPIATEQPFHEPSVELSVKYQLCSDITHMCYRPQTAQLSLALPTASATKPSTEQSTQESLSLSDRLLSLFKNNQNNTLLIFGLMLIAGIFSVATPCVYPMLLITSMCVADRANGVSQKVKLHAFVYVQGIIGTYTLLGLIAGMTGGAFNSLMQSAWINIGFALFFGFFAIAMLGFYELAFMQNEVHRLEQRSYQIKGLTGTWLMGTLAGLVISPCVGPIVFALLLQVADHIAEKANALTAIGQNLSFWDKLGIASQGSIMMSGFGVGVGLPFFLISVADFRKRIPKSGYWMNKVKHGFGLVILYFAYLYFAKGMGVFGVEPNVTLSLAIGMVAVWIAVVHCNVLSLLPADAMPNQKMHHYCGVMSLIIGVWLVVTGLGETPMIKGRAGSTATNSQHLADPKQIIEEDAGILWYRDFDAAQKVAKQTGKPIFIDFYASWCANCIAFKAETKNNAQLNRVLRENAVAVKLVDKEPDFEKFRENPEHRQLKIGLPYFAVLSPEGKLIWSGTDYSATEQMVAVLSKKE